MKKAKHAYEGLESYEIGYKNGQLNGFSSGVDTSMRIMNCWLDTAYDITSDKDEFYKFMKDTFKLDGGIGYDKSGEKEEGFCKSTQKAEVSKPAL